VIDACVIVCRYAWDSLRFQEGDQLIAPDIEKEVAKPAAFFDRYRVRDDGLESKNAFVKGTGLVEVKRRQANVGKSSVTHFCYFSCLHIADDRDVASQ
jgi:hypothetical protein